MSIPPYPTLTSVRGRVFATYPAAVIVLIVNEKEELLLLSNPKRPPWWEAVNGAVDADETILDAALREVREEAGEAVRVRPLGIVHVSTFTYDAHAHHMISITYLMAYQGGEVIPGDDMRGSQVMWVPLTQLGNGDLSILPPLDKPWMGQRALELFRLWNPQPDYPLQPPLAETNKNKYDLHAPEQ